MRKCKCLYESDCHGIEMIKSPSGKEWAIGGTDTKDRWKFCPWCGGALPKGRISDEEPVFKFRPDRVLFLLKPRRKKT